MSKAVIFNSLLGAILLLASVPAFSEVGGTVYITKDTALTDATHYQSFRDLMWDINAGKRWDGGKPMGSGIGNLTVLVKPGQYLNDSFAIDDSNEYYSLTIQSDGGDSSNTIVEWQAATGRFDYIGNFKATNLTIYNLDGLGYAEGKVTIENCIIRGGGNFVSGSYYENNIDVSVRSSKFLNYGNFIDIPGLGQDDYVSVSINNCLLEVKGFCSLRTEDGHIYLSVSNTTATGGISAGSNYPETHRGSISVSNSIIGGGISSDVPVFITNSIIKGNLQMDYAGCDVMYATITGSVSSNQPDEDAGAQNYVIENSVIGNTLSLSVGTEIYSSDDTLNIIQSIFDMIFHDIAVGGTINVRISDIERGNWIISAHGESYFYKGKSYPLTVYLQKPYFDSKFGLQNTLLDNLGRGNFLNTDVYGAPRSKTTPDIGAVEFNAFTSSSTIDGGLRPINKSPLGSNESLHYQVTNSGNTDIMNAQVEYTVSGDSSYSFQGNLSVVAADTQIIAVDNLPHLPGKYKIKIRLIVTGDRDTLNNNITMAWQVIKSTGIANRLIKPESQCFILSTASQAFQLEDPLDNVQLIDLASGRVLQSPKQYHRGWHSLSLPAGEYLLAGYQRSSRTPICYRLVIQ